MDDADFLDPFERLLADAAPIGALRSIEAGAPIDALWTALETSGFLDVLVPTSVGGADLSFAVAGRLVQALGRCLVPAPVAETMIARGLLGRAGAERVDEPIVLVTASPVDGGGFRSGVTPHAAVARYALVDLGAAELVLTDLRGASLETAVNASQARSVVWAATPSAIRTMARPAGGLRPLAALVRAAAIAGASEAVASMTIAYAGARSQFGKAIGKNQAIQQQLTIMAEQVVMARTAAQIGFRDGMPPPMRAAAIAKQIAGNAAQQIAAIAHAVHGAIGISEEYDLQLYTRRLHEWRLADGSETYWARLLGTERLTTDVPSIEFLRSGPMGGTASGAVIR